MDRQSDTPSLNLDMTHFRCLSTFMVLYVLVQCEMLLNFSVHTKSITSLDVILPVLPSAINQSFMKNTHKLTHSSHALIHPYKSKIILKQLHPNI